MSEVVNAEDIKKEEGVINVLVAIPNEGHAPVEAYANRLVNFMNLGKIQERGRLLKSNPRFEFYFVTLGRIFTPLARELAAEQCLAAGCDYLFMIDDDMICPDDLFERLYAHDVDIVSPLAFTRNFPHHPVMYALEEKFDPVTQAHGYKRRIVHNYPKDRLVECDAVGFGAALIKAEVLKKMPKPWFMCSEGTGEDILFCHNARRLGFRVFMDTLTKLGHLSHPVNVTEDYVTHVRKMGNFEIEKRSGEYEHEAKVILGD